MINELLSSAKKNNIELEVYKERNINSSIEVYDNKIESFETFDITSYKIKAIYNKKTINIETEKIDDVENIIKLIKEQSDIIDNNEEDSLANNSEVIECVINDKKFDYNQIQKNMLDFYKFKTKYDNISSIMTSVSIDRTDIGIYNTLGTKLEDSNSCVLCMSEIVMNFNGKNKTNYRYFYDKNYEIDKFYDMIEQLIKETIEKEMAESIETQKYNIVLDNRCVANLLSHFSNIYDAENINKNKSVLSKKFNEKVFSDKITIVEDPQNENYIGKRLFDDEGTKTFYKEIIKNGYFITKLYDNKTAIKDKTKSTGNSFGTRNMYIVPGQLNKNELIKELNDGIYITYIEGLHAGIDNTTGDISLQAEGYLIKNGEKEKALNMIILSTNIFELFKNVIEVGNDLEFFSITSGAPSLLIRDITIVGQK